VSLAVRRGLITLVAVLIAEAVWILAVPPFAGSDEVDHAYRAAGVASGQWHLDRGSPHGIGLLAWVPSDVVAAAEGQCAALPYMERDNCHAVETSGDRSLVTTSAGAYDPFFYLVVGSAAKPFHGAGADYAMRVTTALLCALLLALGVGLMTFAGTGRWANLGVLAAFTPEVLFSGAIPSPNGVEMAAAFVLWAALLATVRQSDDPCLQRRLLVMAGAAALPLTFMRLLGPLWVLLIVGAVIATVGWRQAGQIARRHRGVVATIAVITAIGVCWWAAWQRTAGHTTGVHQMHEVERWILAFNLPAFLMQMIGAFPYRDVPAPLGVYPLEFSVILLMLGAAWRRGPTHRSRRAVLWITIAALVVPVLLSLVFMPSLGAIWQGRYELPFVIGVLPLCGLLLDEAGFAPVEGRRLVALSGLFLLVSHVACVYHVEQHELGRPASADDPAWWHPSGYLLGALMLGACGVAWQLMRVTGRASPAVEEPPRPEVNRSRSEPAR
jgi:hypothetical protein